MKGIATLIVLLLCAMSHRGLGQEVYQEVDCATQLLNADNEFAAGRFYGLPTMLKECLDGNQFSKDEQLHVYMLLTQVHLLTDDPASAEESYLKLLTADPEFVAAAEKDPIDVVYLSKKFTTTPIFTPHFKFGGNFSTQTILVPVNTIAQPETVSFDRTPKPGLNIGAGIEWNINDNIGIGGEAILSYKSFKQVTSGIHGHDSLQVIERQYGIDVPVYLRYGYHLGKLRPFVYAGYAVNFLIAARLNLQALDLSSEGTTQTPTVGPNIGIDYKRDRINGSLVFGGGIKYKWGKNFLLFDLRYMRGLTNVTNEWNPYDDKDSYGLTPDLARYGNIGDWFRVNSYSLSFGFVRPLYDPRRVNKVKTKGVSRKVSKE